MEEGEGRGDAKGRVLGIMEEGKTWMAAEGTGARSGAKGGGVIPAKRRLVKRMMWDRAVNWVSFGDAKGRVLGIMEEGKTWMAAEGTGARSGAKGGGVIPAKRRLVKRMMWDRAVNWVSFAFSGPCFGSSATHPEPVRAKETAVGVAEVLFLCPASISDADETKDSSC